MKEIYFSRHGITNDLENGIRNRREAILTDAGYEDAHTTGRQLLARFVVPRLIVCSTLPRAIDSAETIAEVVGYEGEIIRSELLDERDAGIAKGMKNADIKRLYPGGFDTIPGAESTQATQERAAEAAAWLERLTDDALLAVGHGVSGRAIARHYMGIPYTGEFDPAVRELTNLGNGQIMRLAPDAIELLPIKEV